MMQQARLDPYQFRLYIVFAFTGAYINYFIRCFPFFSVICMDKVIDNLNLDRFTADSSFCPYRDKEPCCKLGSVKLFSCLADSVTLSCCKSNMTISDVLVESSEGVGKLRRTSLLYKQVFCRCGHSLRETNSKLPERSPLISSST